MTPVIERAGCSSPSCRKADGILFQKSLLQPATKNPPWTIHRPVPQTDTGGPGEHPQAFGRTLVKELGKMTLYLRYKGCSPPGEPQNRH